MVYYVYVLLSKKDHKLYVGYTHNLKRRVVLHKSGKVDATRPRLPVSLIYFEGFVSKEDALMREKFLKSGWGRRHLQSALQYTLSGMAERLD